MIRFLKIFLLLSSILVLTSCGSVNNADLNKSIGQNIINAPLNSGYNTLLYKAKVKLYSKTYSGLFLFKHSPKTKIHNVVFLSEVGLTLFELKYENNSFEVVKMSAIFKNDKAAVALMSDLEMVICDIYEKENVKLVDGEDSKSLKKTRKRSLNYYIYNSNNEIYKIKKNGLLKGLDIELQQYENQIPKSIIFNHKNIKLNINLSLLKRDNNVR